MPELTLERTINLPIADAFAAWTQPNLLSRWFAPGNMSCDAQADAKVGGQYRVAMHDPDNGEDYIVTGRYSVVDAPIRLVFDWRWTTSDVMTQVEVRFQALAEAQTRVVLHHRDFPDQDLCDKHTEGWAGCLTNLASRFNLVTQS